MTYSTETTKLLTCVTVHGTAIYNGWIAREPHLRLGFSHSDGLSCANTMARFQFGPLGEPHDQYD